MKHEVFILGGQRIDQKSKKGGDARGNEEREKRRIEKGTLFFKPSGYDKLEFKQQNLVFSSL